MGSELSSIVGHPAGVGELLGGVEKTDIGIDVRMEVTLTSWWCLLDKMKTFMGKSYHSV